jgi:hypothetical protein
MDFILASNQWDASTKMQVNTCSNHQEKEEISRTPISRAKRERWSPSLRIPFHVLGAGYGLVRPCSSTSITTLCRIVFPFAGWAISACGWANHFRRCPWMALKPSIWEIEATGSLAQNRPNRPERPIMGLVTERPESPSWPGLYGYGSFTAQPLGFL